MIMWKFTGEGDGFLTRSSLMRLSYLANVLLKLYTRI